MVTSNEHARGQKRRRMCHDKQRYHDHEEAILSARSYQRKRQTHLRAYECPFCNGWHLTKQAVGR